jgi:hypothetical protein
MIIIKVSVVKFRGQINTRPASTDSGAENAWAITLRIGIRTITPQNRRRA